MDSNCSKDDVKGLSFAKLPDGSRRFGKYYVVPVNEDGRSGYCVVVLTEEDGLYHPIHPDLSSKELAEKFAKIADKKYIYNKVVYTGLELSVLLRERRIPHLIHFVEKINNNTTRSGDIYPYALLQILKSIEEVSMPLVTIF